VSERGRQKRDLGCDCDHAAETVLLREVVREMNRGVRRELERKRQSWRLPRGAQARMRSRRSVPPRSTSTIKEAGVTIATASVYAASLR
jgi:hypothetical protein